MLGEVVDVNKSSSGDISDVLDVKSATTRATAFFICCGEFILLDRITGMILGILIFIFSMPGSGEEKDETGRHY